MTNGRRYPGRSMALLSVVLVVHDEQAYIDGCVRGFLDAAGSEIQLVVVDNGSGGHVPELLQELAAADTRVLVHRLDGPVPMGSARAVGVAAATGDYVWFVDTTDRIEPEHVRLVVDRLRDSLDVLVVDYVVGGVLGVAPSPHAKLVRGLGGRVVNVQSRPDLLDLAGATWSLIVRKTLLDEWGITTDGARSELAYGFEALLAAESVAAAPSARYRRLTPPNAVRLAAIHGDESDVVVSAAAVLDFVDAHASRLAQTRRFVVQRLAALTVQRMRQLPVARRLEFAAAASRVFAEHRSDDAMPRGRAAALRMQLLRDGHPRLLVAIDSTIGRVRAIAAGRRTRSRRHRRQSWRNLPYRLQRMLPVDQHLAVFAAYWYAGYSCNPRAVYEKMRELAPSMRGVWVVEKGVAVPAGIDVVRPGTRSYFRVLARAKYFVNNVGFPDHWDKRPGTVLVHTHHGTPLKVMGLDQTRPSGAALRQATPRQLTRWAKWDFSVSSNRLSTLVWERVYPARYETLEYGYPRNDRLANADGGDYDRLRTDLGIPAGTRVLLYAPTHREYEEGYRQILDTAMLADALGAGWIVLSRAHYFYDGADRPEAAADGRVRDVTGHDSIEELCIAADVLITDYSSVMFDYAVLDRPIVIYAPDWETYRDRRGTYFDVTAEPPGVVARTLDDLAAAFTSGAYNGDVATKARRLFRARFCAWDDGKAAERVVRRVFLGEHPEPPSVAA